MLQTTNQSCCHGEIITKRSPRHASALASIATAGANAVTAGAAEAPSSTPQALFHGGRQGRKGPKTWGKPWENDWKRLEMS